MADALKDVQKSFDNLVRDIIGHINRIINKLKKDKENTIRIYKDEVRGYYLSRREAVDNRGAQFDTLAKEKEAQIPPDKKGEFDALVAQLQTLRNELEKMMEREMQIESGVALKIKDEPARIEKEIGLMNSLLEYIKSHVKVGKLFSKGKLISRLNTKAIYDRIVKVYNEVKSRETEKKVVEYYFKMKDEIEQKSDEILSGIKKLMTILGVEEEAVSPKAVKKKEKAVEKAEDVLKKEENYFMLFSKVLEQLRNVVASNMPPKQKLKEARPLLKKLKRYETREQWRASVSNLKRKLDKLLKIPSISQQKKQEIEKDVRELKIFEGDLLVKTVRELGKKIKKRVQAEQVNWQEFNQILIQIERDIQAAIAIDQRLDKLLESERRGIRGKVGAGLGATGRVVGGVARGVGAGLGAARRLTQRGPTVSQAAGAVRGAISDIGLKAVIEKERVAGAIGGVIGRLPNPIPSLRKWASDVRGASKKLEERLRRGKLSKPVWDKSGRTWIDERGEVWVLQGVAVAEPEVEERINILRRVAQVIGNLDPRKSAKLTGLANNIGGLKDRIFANLGKLRIPGLTRKQTEEITEEIEKDAAAAGEAAAEAEKELSKIAQLKGWIGNRMSDIDLKGKVRAVGGATKGIVGRIRRRR